MRSFIKGSYEAVLGIDATGARRPGRAGIPVDDAEALLSLGEERLRLSPEQRREAFEHPEVATHLKLLYTAVTRSQRRLNIVETTTTKAASAFFRQLEEKGKLVKLATDCELKLAAGMMSPDEWIH